METKHSSKFERYLITSVVSLLVFLGVVHILQSPLFGSAEAAPPTTTTYWLITGHPDTPVFHELPSDPTIGFELNWIVINHADGTQSAFDRNCKVAYLNEVTGEWDRVEYYGNDYVAEAESMGGFAPPAMVAAE